MIEAHAWGTSLCLSLREAENEDRYVTGYRVDLCKAQGGCTSLHRHPDVEQTIKVLSGRLVLETEVPSGEWERRIMDAGEDSLRTSEEVIPPGVRHRLIFPDSTEVVFLEVYCWDGWSHYSIERYNEGSAVWPEKKPEEVVESPTGGVWQRLLSAVWPGGNR